MSTTIQLLGRPRITRGPASVYKFRSRKSWALLAYLILGERPPTRSQLASLLFGGADDPVRALRWSLAEIRRALGDDGSVDGDPVVLQLPPGAVVDVQVVMKGTWTDAVGLPGLGADLLEGMAVKGAAAFETWLLAQQRHAAAASEAVLHEAALGSMARGALEAAIGYAVRAAAMSPLDENHQALLIRLYRMAGDDDAAARQFAACAKALRAELGVAPGPAVQAAMRQPRSAPDEVADEATIEAIIEAGSAAVSAGVVEAGVQSLRTAARLADGAGATRLRVSSRLVLAEALVHALGGLDEEGLAALHEADEIALAHGLLNEVAQARAELGYVDFLRGRYDRAEHWLTDALEYASGSPSMQAKVHDLPGLGGKRPRQLPARRRPPGAGGHAVPGGCGSRDGRPTPCPCWAGSACSAVIWTRPPEQLDASIKLAEDDHWLSFLPWPQALRGEVQLARDDPAGAAELLQHAFARACQLGDPCWEGMAGPGPRPGGRGDGRHRAGLRAAGRRPGPLRPAGRTLSLARRLHPRRAVRARPATRPSGYRRLDRDAAGPGLPVGDERTHPPLAAARRRPRPRRRRRRRGRAGGRDRRVSLARGGHAWDSHGYRSVSLAA